MKKIFLIAAAFFAFQGYAQKTFEVYNFTTQTVKLLDIITKASGTYPEFHSKATPVTIPANGSYVLDNPTHPTRFPFHSPASSPYIPTWERLSSPTTSNMIASNIAWTMGSPQDFYRMGFSVGASGTGIDTTNTASNPVIGAGFTAEYSVYIAPPPSTVIIYTIIIY